MLPKRTKLGLAMELGLPRTRRSLMSSNFRHCRSSQTPRAFLCIAHYCYLVHHCLCTTCRRLLASYPATDRSGCLRPCQIHQSTVQQQLCFLRSIDSQPPPSDCSTLDCSLFEVAQPLRCSHIQLQRCRDSAECRLPARTPLPDTCTTQGSQTNMCHCPQHGLYRLQTAPW